MNQTSFNPAQLHLLKMFSFVKSEENLLEIKNLLATYFAQKIDAEMDALWDEGKIDANTIEQWANEHLRTPYK